MPQLTDTFAGCSGFTHAGGVGVTSTEGVTVGVGVGELDGVGTVGVGVGVLVGLGFVGVGLLEQESYE